MKRLLILLLLAAGTALAAMAQREQDFAARFNTLYGERYDLELRTISPQMMERILRLDDVENNDRAASVLSQLKSIRILTAGRTAAEAESLFAMAEALADKNRRRYRLHAHAAGQSVYTRRHGNQLVELVVIRVKDPHTFYLIDLTGNMSDDIISQILSI